MATKVRRVVSDFAQHGMNYLFHRDKISPLERERDREKKWLKTYIGDGENDGMGVADESGNLNVYFEGKFVPGPGDTKYWGLQQRRVPGAAYMDTDEIKKFVAKLAPELQQRVVYNVTTEVVDADELYKLFYEKKITEKQLRALEHHHKDNYQLWPITDEPPEAVDE